MSNIAHIPSSARWLGYAGVLPFAFLAIVHAAWASALALQAFLYYGAVILSFLGGIRWGAAVRSEAPAKGLAFSVLPSLWAFTCLLLPDTLATAWGLLLGFCLVGLADWRLPEPGLPAWMKSLRVQLSIAVILCHLVVVL